jgi:hypothetical protein
LLPERYPRLTLLLQALGSVRVGYEALRKLVPAVSQAVSMVNLLISRSVCRL